MNHLPGPSGTEHQIVRSSSGSTVFQRAAALGSRNSSSSSNPGARVQRFARPTIFANRSRRNERQPKPVTYSRDIFASCRSSVDEVAQLLSLVGLEEVH
jgi:hypothetical protein